MDHVKVTLSKVNKEHTQKKKKKSKLCSYLNGQENYVTIGKQ